MKAKNLFFGALACLAFAACSNDDEPIVNGGAQAEGSNTYVAVQLVMAGSSSTTRAWSGDDDADDYYAEGSTKELTVNKATFFFFDADGKKVQTAYTCTIGEPTDGTKNTIDDEYNAYIVINGTIPARIAAVLNLDENAYAALKDMNETELYKALSTNSYNWAGCESGKFVMTSSTFVNDGTLQIATPVTSANIIKSETEPTVGSQYTGDVKPVVLPVERLFARINVKYTKNTNDADDILETDLQKGQSTNVDLDNNPNTENDVAIKAFITGWWLHSTNKDSYLFKDLKTSYSWDATSSAPEGWWNDPVDARSYWAEAYKKDSENTADFNSYKYSSANLVDKYCFENTNADNATTLMVAAILKKYNTTLSKWEKIDLIQWLGQNFEGLDNFKTFIAGYLTEQGYSNNGANLTANDLVAIYNNNTNKDLNTYDWQTRIGLAEGVTLKVKTVDAGGNVSWEDCNAEQVLANKVGFFKYYKDGQTYYFTKIQHEPSIDETKYAVIRNHKYVININGITGLGTPVPNPSDNPKDPEDPTPDPTTPEPDPEYPDPTGPTPDPTDPDQPIDPETPTDDYSSISAKIRVLEYRIVKQDVTLDNQK